MSQQIGKPVEFKNFPELSPKLKRRVLVGIRPFRKGGIRLELQRLRNKTIIYNYGHGGAGVSLAPACGLQSAQLAAKNSSDKKVAVLGSGIIGLFTALQCAEKGLSVTVYADRIPKTNEKNVLDMCTSQIAPGYWLPFHYQFSDLEQHRIRTEISFKKYNEWTKKSKHIYEVECWQQMKPELFKQSAPVFIAENSKSLNIKIGDKQFDVIYFKTLQINLQNYLHDLIQQCQKKGVRFENKSIKGIEDILNMKQSIVVACLGLNSKFIFNDNNVYGVKGHLVELANSTGIKGVLGFEFDGGELGMYCFKDKILIGLSRQRNQKVTINQQTVKELEDRAYKFYKHVGLDIKPKL